jgi:type IX secretion system PorP/SprF family membrane protein
MKMPHTIRYTLLLGILLTLLSGQAQDPHYSQFYAAPVQMNPALSGVFPGSFRVVANYRTQNYAVLGNQAYRTLAASVDTRNRVGRSDFYSLGLAVMQDEAGEANFRRSKAMFSGAYLKHLGGGRYRSGDQYLVAGAQLGVGQWAMDWENLWFSEQFEVQGSNAAINFGAPNNEPNLNANRTDLFVDFNAGLLYYNVIDADNSFYIGGAIHHINQPNVSFIENANAPLTQRYLAQAGGEIGLTRELSLLPAVAVMSQGSAFLGIGGMNLRYRNRDWREVAIRAGLWGRVVNQRESGMGLDAVVVSAILELERIQIGLNYDLTVSTLSEANDSRGAFELALIYVAPSKARFKVDCPRF